jgi:hypothetical protein
MSTSPLSGQDIRAAAEVHHELGPEYSDAVVANFVDKLEDVITERVNARLAAMAPQPVAVPPRRHRGRAAVAVAVACAAVGVVGGASVAVTGSHGQPAAPISREVPGQITVIPPAPAVPSFPHRKHFTFHVKRSANGPG